MASQLFIVFMALFCASVVMADVYMQNPRGNNDRVNEDSQDRNNANRLFDSENNARGGYCWGPDLAYHEGSYMTIQWTAQHACGTGKTACNIVLQYMCSDETDGAAQTIRDGTTTTTIPANAAGAADQKFGMNEPLSNYQDCVARARNKGLFTADQNVANDKGAMATRQNNNGEVHGYECSEERDYYPYWHPSPWKDIAILYDDNVGKAACEAAAKESQNVKDKNYCAVTGNPGAGKVANNEANCTSQGGKWSVAPNYGLSQPECVKAPQSRDNHLGNTIDGETAHYNWTLPRAAEEACITEGKCACVTRIRYNISSTEVPADADASLNGKAKSPVVGNPTVEASGFNATLAINTAQTGRVFQDRSFMFRLKQRPDGVSASTPIYNLNVRGKRGNIVQTYPATEYDFVPTHLEVEKDALVDIQWTGCDTNPQGNTGEGKQKTDRSNIVQIRDMNDIYPLSNKDIETEGIKPLFADPAVRLRMATIDQEIANPKACNPNTNDQQANDNCKKLNGAATPRFVGGLVKMSEEGTFYFMNTRNNNFSNRQQKGSITVKSSWPAWKTAVIATAGSVAVVGGAAAGTVAYAKFNPHSRVADLLRNVPGLKNRI